MRAYAIELDPPLDDVSAGVPRRATVDVPSGPAARDISMFALTLSETAGAILRLAAAHDGVSEAELVTRLVCQHADRVGLPALLKGGP